MKEAKALSVAEAERILSPWLALIGRAQPRAPAAHSCLMRRERRTLNF
jgi:hypothetical protein